MNSGTRFFVSSRQLSAFAVVMLLHMGCDSAAPANAPTSSALKSTKMKLGGGDFVIEIANTDPVREFGLMKRDYMAENHGMIFVFGDEQPRAFWMKNTRIPLDIAYLDSSGKVVSIKQMKAYDLTSVPSDYPAKYAIELNLGIAAKAGLKPGDHVDIPPEAKEPKD